MSASAGRIKMDVYDETCGKMLLAAHVRVIAMHRGMGHKLDEFESTVALPSCLWSPPFRGFLP